MYNTLLINTCYSCNYTNNTLTTDVSVNSNTYTSLL